MADPMEVLPERVNAIEQKLNALTVSVDERFDRVENLLEARFELIDQAFAEQRRFTEFVFSGLRDQMHARFEAVDRRFDAVDHRFDAADRRFDAVDRRFDAVDLRFERLEKKVDWIVDHLSRGSR